MSSQSSQNTARRFDRRRKHKAERVRLRGARPAGAAATAPAPTVRPSSRTALAERLQQRSGGSTLLRRPGVRPAVRRTAPAAAVPVPAPAAPPSVLEEFRTGFDRIENAIREAGGLTSRSELDALSAENDSLQRSVADQQAVIAAKDEELNALRARLAAGESG